MEDWFCAEEKRPHGSSKASQVPDYILRLAFQSLHTSHEIIIAKLMFQHFFQLCSDTEVIVKVFGQRPDNILLMVHEVFESLIDEFYQGVKYEYVLPCADCIKVVRTQGLSPDYDRNV